MQIGSSVGEDIFLSIDSIWRWLVNMVCIVLLRWCAEKGKVSGGGWALEALVTTG